MKFLSLFLFILSISSFSWAEGRAGNGGYGVYVGDQLYLYDFVEAGIEKTAFFDDTLEIDQEITGRVAMALGHIQGMPLSLISRKLTEIKGQDPAMAEFLMKAMQMYSWKAPASLRLIPLDDTDGPLLVAEEKGYIQLAVRRRKNIFIDRKYWKLLDEKNKTGLVFHEIFYSYLPFQKRSIPVLYAGEVNIESCLAQSNFTARSLTSDIFLKAYQKSNIDNFNLFPWRPNQHVNGVSVYRGDKIFAVIQNGVFLPFVGTSRARPIDIFAEDYIGLVKNYIKMVQAEDRNAWHSILPVGGEYSIRYFEQLSCGNIVVSGLRISFRGRNSTSFISKVYLKRQELLQENAFEYVDDAINLLKENPVCLNTDANYCF